MVSEGFKYQKVSYICISQCPSDYLNIPNFPKFIFQIIHTPAYSGQKKHKGNYPKKKDVGILVHILKREEGIGLVWFLTNTLNVRERE